MENYKGEIWVSQPDDKQDSIFRRGEIVEKVKDTENSTIYKVKLKDNDELVDADLKNIHKANPIRFDGYDDMASLTYLNEPSILNNLKVRYQDDKIYTHSGLFLVTVNPYKKINIYNSDFITLYSANEKKCNQPHIFGTAQKAFDSLIKNKKDQSILVTGESGAGKTENTKRVIQYILSVATNVENKQSAAVLENQILQANPILESFGNATTVRNLNSSRFGKFVKIQIDSSNSQLVGAHVDYYLLEKSRVIFQDSNERNYHVFYQLLKGAPLDLLERLHLNNKSLNQYEYLKSGLTTPVGNIDDKKEFQNLINAFKIMSFNDEEVLNIFKILAIILHLGNIKFKNSLNDTKQAVLLDESNETIDKVALLLGVSSQEFRKSFLNSKIKIGREIVNQQRTAAQAKFSIDALSKSLYEKLFQYLIDNINRSFNSSTNQNEFMDISDNYIGILDIAGEIWVSQPDDKQDSIFRRGEIIEKVKDTENSTIYKVKLKDNDELVDADLKNIHKANPIRFDGYDDMASLTYLNEPSILNNLKVRYQDDKIYTHSGLFLVTVNPYKKINIYNSDFITLYSASEKKCNQPHIFGTAQKAFDSLIKNKKDQSILVTGESGAGKTENTKRVIQYILSVATNVENKQSAAVLENQILQANPILESFGNATTVRNLNSSRFGKFVKIQIDSSNSQLVGAHVDYYLLEKSRVIFQDSNERNYHVFYQLLKGAPLDLLERLHLNNKSLNQYEYLKSGLTTPVGNIDDKKEFQNLINAFKIMSFDDEEVLNIFKVLAIILHLGNIKFKNSLNDTKQAVLLDESNETIDKVALLLGVSSQEFRKSFLNSKIKIGREIVNQQRTAAQAKFSIDALSKSLYEKLFQYLIDNINRSFNSSTNQNEFMDISDNYIGILDIA
ncbi:hypothetical protein JL09_g485, partial [Pichia kudriavzevii]